ncbi:MAG: nuclear transport factor 2 family protein [Acidobacteriota bacterium]
MPDARPGEAQRIVAGLVVHAVWVMMRDWKVGVLAMDIASETEADALLAANLEFYRAFTTHDVAAMDRIWAQETPVLCLHPGWTLLRGRKAVMESWRQILGNPDAPNVMVHEDQAFLFGEVGIVTCEEELGGGWLAATNMFVKEDGVWRLVHHQASPIMSRAAEEQPKPGRLH